MQMFSVIEISILIYAMCSVGTISSKVRELSMPN